MKIKANMHFSPLDDFEPIDLYFHLSIQDSEKQQQNFYIFSPNVVLRRTEDCR
jgi:hypothetical protein